MTSFCHTTISGGTTKTGISTIRVILVIKGEHLASKLYQSAPRLRLLSVLGH